MISVRLEVEGMEGSADARRLRRALRKLHPTTSVQVDPEAGEVEVGLEGSLDEAANDLREAVERSGYRLVGLEPL